MWRECQINPLVKAHLPTFWKDRQQKWTSFDAINTVTQSTVFYISETHTHTHVFTTSSCQFFLSLFDCTAENDGFIAFFNCFCFIFTAVFSCFELNVVLIAARPCFPYRTSPPRTCFPLRWFAVAVLRDEQITNTAAASGSCTALYEAMRIWMAGWQTRSLLYSSV